jgi:hypothetical protein
MREGSNFAFLGPEGARKGALWTRILLQTIEAHLSTP